MMKDEEEEEQPNERGTSRLRSAAAGEADSPLLSLPSSQHLRFYGDGGNSSGGVGCRKGEEEEGGRMGCRVR